MALDPTYHTTVNGQNAPASGVGKMPLPGGYALRPLGSMAPASTGTPVPQAFVGNPNPDFAEGPRGQWFPTAGPTPATPTVGGTGGTIPTGTAYVKLAWGSDWGTTPAGGEASVAITLGQNLTVVVPAFPTGATKCIIGVGTAAGGETQQMTVYAPGSFTIGAIAGGQPAMPAANTIGSDFDNWAQN